MGKTHGHTSSRSKSWHSDHERKICKLGDKHGQRQKRQDNKEILMNIDVDDLDSHFFKTTAYGQGRERPRTRG